MAIILALQYFEGDQSKAISLARLLADLEDTSRKDALLALICQPDTPDSQQIIDTIDYCSKKFQVLSIKSRLGGKGWIDGGGQLWTGTMEYFGQAFEAKKIEHDSIFTFQPDCVPLHKNWIDLLEREHSKTIQSGKLITGTVIDKGVLHVNSNMVSHLSLWTRFPIIHNIRLTANDIFCDMMEYQHRNVFLDNCSGSSAICSEWMCKGITKELLAKKAKHSIWLHGWKDENLQDITRQFLSGQPHTELDIQRQDLAAMKKAFDEQVTKMRAWPFLSKTA